jgi:DNA-directed RNA polymerase subunit M
MYPVRKGGAQVLKCRSCGYEVDSQGAQGYKFSTKVKHSPRERIIVIRQEDETAGAQVLKGVVSCPKCGHDEVMFWMMQTRSADEPMTRFYRCLRCKHTWREYA